MSVLERHDELRIAYLALINPMSLVLARMRDLDEPHGHVAFGTNGMLVVGR